MVLEFNGNLKCLGRNQLELVEAGGRLMEKLSAPDQISADVRCQAVMRVLWVTLRKARVGMQGIGWLRGRPYRGRADARRAEIAGGRSAESGAASVFGRQSVGNVLKARSDLPGVRNPVLEPAKKGLMALSEAIRYWSMRLNGPDGREARVIGEMSGNLLGE